MGPEKLRMANLKLNPFKCKLFCCEVSYLGHIISAKGVRRYPEKIWAVENWSRPKDLHQLRNFLVLCIYCRKFVMGFSTLDRPLHKLTEAKQKFQWTEECEKAFEKLKEVLTPLLILAHPQLQKLF